MIDQVEIFSSSNQKGVSDLYNQWRKEHPDAKINERMFSTAMAARSDGKFYVYSIAVFYEEA